MALPAKVPKKKPVVTSTPTERLSRNRPIPTAEDWKPLFEKAKEAIRVLGELLTDAESEKNRLDAAKFLISIFFPQPKALEIDLSDERSPDETREIQLAMVKALKIGNNREALEAIGFTVETHGVKNAPAGS